MGNAQPVTDTTTLHCANHPAVETLLRCSKCGKPICGRCGVPTEVGVRCRECAQLRRPPAYMVGLGHYVVAAAVALPASAVAGLIMQQVGFYLAFFLGAAVGGLVAEAVYRATGGKRGRGLALLVSVCIVLGAVVSAAITTLAVPGVSLAAVLAGQNLLALFYRLNVVYVVLAIGAAYARLL